MKLKKLKLKSRWNTWELCPRGKLLKKKLKVKKQNKFSLKFLKII
jgi:hypothetical protein